MKHTVSIFKKVKDVSNSFNKDVSYALGRIKSGKSSEIVNWLRTLDKEGYDANKILLPITCFNATFRYRSNAGVVDRSGLIILDFDKFASFEEAVDFRESLKSNEYVFAAWVSPSGRGVKVLIRITTDKPHIAYFKALKAQFDHPNWDDTGSDISRACFESFDPDIYINTDSLIFNEVGEPDIHDIGVQKAILPIRSENNIIDNLLKWWNKKLGASAGSRNKNLFILASSFNDFGVNRSEAERILVQYSEKDFPEKEILTLIKSAYKQTQNFGTRFFEDSARIERIEKQVLTGCSNELILDDFDQDEHKSVKRCIDKVKSFATIEQFWEYDEKGTISLVVHKYKFWLEQNNFFKYFPTESNTFTFVKIEQNLVDETNEKRIKDFTLENLLHRKEVGFTPYDFMAARTKFFSVDFLSFLESSNIKMMKDTRDTGYLYYQNCAVAVTKSTIEEIDYIDVDGYVWRRQVTARNFAKVDHHRSEFRRFIWLCSGEDVAKYKSMKSVIGYLMHSFKTSANNKAIIFNDETISDNPNGGSGKSLFWNALKKMKKVSDIDGKTFEFTKSFPYQTVSTDTQLLVFDDVKKNFNFESLFSLITEGITLEYKGQDAIKLPVDESPKIIITTNYSIGGKGGSFDRRKFEVEMSSYFSKDYTPEMEFGHLLFDDWDDNEWLRFDNYMINCMQYYLTHGLVSHEFKNLEIRKFIRNTSHDFYEWITDENNFAFSVRYIKADLHDLFLKDFPDQNTYKFKLSIRQFMKWVKEYSDFVQKPYNEGNTNGKRWFCIGDESSEVAPF